jgi:hypothetical protein
MSFELDATLVDALRRALRNHERALARGQQEDREIAWGVSVDRAVRKRHEAARRTEPLFIAPEGVRA